MQPCKSIGCSYPTDPEQDFCRFCLRQQHLQELNIFMSVAQATDGHSETITQQHIDPHQPGAKLDTGKIRPSLIIEGMARAVWAVSEVATFGAAKYTPDGWVLVPNGTERYADAGYRHTLKRAIGEPVDSESNLNHLAHEAWNALAKLDLYLREEETTN